MDAQQYYAVLGKTDRERVEAVVAAFKSGGLQVYANFPWKNIMRSEIGLAVVTGAGMTRGDVQHSVDDVVRQFHGQLVREVVPEGWGEPEHSEFPPREDNFTDGYLEHLRREVPENRTSFEKFSIPLEKFKKKNYIKEFNKSGPHFINEFNEPIPHFKEFNFLPRVREPENPDYNPLVGRYKLQESVERLTRAMTANNQEWRKNIECINPKPIIPPPLSPESLREIMRAFEKHTPSQQPAAVREQRYRIGTIGETPIDITVSYKPADTLTKLTKVEL